MTKLNDRVVQRWRFFCVSVVLCLLTILWALPSNAQKKQMVQIKTFDQHLAPFKNISLSINGKEHIAVGNKGNAFIELLDSDFPLKSITVKEEKLEAASWNYSKGILEVIIRAKNYQVVQVVVRDTKGVPLPNLRVTFKGRKTTMATTGGEGQFDLHLALDEKVSSPAQFSIENVSVTNVSEAEGKSFLTVEYNKSSRGLDVAARSSAGYFKDFDLSKLDSIKSLTVFYAIFKNYQIKDMSDEARKKIDAKFNELVAVLQDSARVNSLQFTGRISDSSYVSDDIKNMLSQAEMENQTLEMQRIGFDQNIQRIQEKLAAGITNLDEATRKNLLSDLTKLERLLIENEGRFYKNQNDYRNIINSLKEKYFDVTDLENKLTQSEAQRLEEQRAFREKLFITLGVLLVFAVLIILLIYFSDRLKKQKKELERVNGEINRINENLESLVAERTKLLEEANKELDTFLYRASHDLRSPVCSIIGLCNIALHLSNGESKDLVERVVLTTTSMDKLLKKLSIISEINQPTNFCSITMLDLMEKVRTYFAPTIQDNRIKLTIDCPADLVIYSYPSLIETILINLMENALFYSVMKDPENASVELAATVKDNNIEISLFDNGIGVGTEISQRLFDMFFKGHENSKGNGLGLYIVQKSVQALEGKIELHSEVGQFTRFIIQIPLKPIAFGQPILPSGTLSLAENF